MWLGAKEAILVELAPKGTQKRKEHVSWNPRDEHVSWMST